MTTLKRLKTTEPQKIGSFTVTPRVTGNTVWFNFSNRGGTARYNLATGTFEQCRGRVGKAMEHGLERLFIE